MSLLSLVGEISFLCPRGKQFPELVLKRARAILKQLCWASLLSSESHQCFAGEISHASTVHQPWAQIVFKIFTCCYNTWVRIPSFVFFSFFFFFAPCDLQDLHFPTRDGIRCPWQWGDQFPTTGPPGRPEDSFNMNLAWSRPAGCTSDLMERRPVDIREISRPYSRLPESLYSILLVQENSVSQDYYMLFLKIYSSL